MKHKWHLNMLLLGKFNPSFVSQCLSFVQRVPEKSDKSQKFIKRYYTLKRTCVISVGRIVRYGSETYVHMLQYYVVETCVKQ